MFEDLRVSGLQALFPFFFEFELACLSSPIFVGGLQALFACWPV